MTDIFASIFHLWSSLVLWLIGFSIAFTLLARLMPCNPGQPVIREGITADVLYWFVMPALNQFVRLLYIGFGAAIIFYGQPRDAIMHYLQNGYGPLAALPIWVQAALILIVSDIILYGTHRWFHKQPMWRFHAIHHSSPHVDWLSTYRFHPVNTWLSFTLVDTLMVLLGFAPAAIASLLTFNIIYSAMVHANLNWTFGPLRYVLASPVFHRWHHTLQAEGRDKNFAPTFPILDVIFGTFYMPKGRLPEHYGVDGEAIPHHFTGQLAWPFRQST